MLELIVGSKIPKVQFEPVSTFSNSTPGQKCCEWGRYTVNFHKSILELPERNILSISWSEKDNIVSRTFSDGRLLLTGTHGWLKCLEQGKENG